MEKLQRREKGISALMTFILSAAATVFLFQTLLENYIYASSYLDEALAALFAGFFVLRLLTDMQIRSQDLVICVMILLVMAAGLYGNYRFQIQEHRAAIILDIVSHFKFAAIYLGTAAAARVHRIDWRRVIRIPAVLAKIYITVLFAFGLLNLAADIGMHSEYRYGIRTYAFVFGTPGIVTNTVLYIIMLLLFESAVCGTQAPQKAAGLPHGRPGMAAGRDRAIGEEKDTMHRPMNMWFLLMAIAVLVFVIKSRSLILAAAAALLYESLLIERKQNIRFRLGAVAAVGGIIGFPQFMEYFVSGAKAVQGKAPRLLFFENGVQLFKEYFPFGTGFGTFGSSSAASYYSQLYYEMGFDEITGMQPENTKYLNDTFWPMILGQLGLAGTIPFVILLFMVLRGIYAGARESGNRYIRFAAVLYVVNVLFSSIQSAYPSNNSMVMLTFIVTLMSMYRANSDVGSRPEGGVKALAGKRMDKYGH